MHPYKLCHAFYEKAKELVGTDLKIAKVTGFEKDNNKISGVQINSNEVLPADIVILAMGPWSNQLAKSFTIPEVFTWKAASVIFKPENPVTAQALFVTYVNKHGQAQRLGNRRHRRVRQPIYKAWPYT